MSGRARLAFLLALACTAGLSAVLANMLGTSLGSPAPAIPTRPVASDDVTPVLHLAAPALSAEAAREIVQRPLFFASRRPLPPEPPPAAEIRAEPPPVLDFTLVGTVLTGQSKIALLKSEKAGSLQVGIGQDVGRWTVTSIGADRIMVRNGAVEQLVGLREFASKAVLPASMHAQAAAPTADRPAAAAIPPPPPSSPIRRAGTRR